MTPGESPVTVLTIPPVTDELEWTTVVAPDMLEFVEYSNPYVTDTPPPGTVVRAPFKVALFGPIFVAASVLTAGCFVADANAKYY